PVSPQLGSSGASLTMPRSASSSPVRCHHHWPSLTHAPCTKTTLTVISSSRRYCPADPSIRGRSSTKVAGSIAARPFEGRTRARPEALDREWRGGSLGAYRVTPSLVRGAVGALPITLRPFALEPCFPLGVLGLSNCAGAPEENSRLRVSVS